MNKTNILDNFYLNQNGKLPIIDPTILEYGSVICYGDGCYVVINGNYRILKKTITLDYDFVVDLYGKNIITKYYKVKLKQ
jgi:hypothetical protein